MVPDRRELQLEWQPTNQRAADYYVRQSDYRSLLLQPSSVGLRWPDQIYGADKHTLHPGERADDFASSARSILLSHLGSEREHSSLSRRRLLHQWRTHQRPQQGQRV